MEFTVGLLAGVTVWTFLGRTLPRRDRMIAQRVWSLLGPSASSPRVRRVRSAKLLVSLGRQLPGDRPSISKSLSSAGMEERSADGVIGVRFALACIGGMLGLLFGPLAPLSGIGLSFLAYRAPEALIRMRAAARRDEVSAAIPQVLDLLAVCTQAGLNVPLALTRVAEPTSGVLGDELRRAVRQIGLGVPRARALEELAARNEVQELQALVSTIVNAERFGTRIAATLTTLSTEIRGARRRHAEEVARRAPVKILFPLVFLILPGFVLLTLVPMILGTFATLGF